MRLVNIQLARVIAYIGNGVCELNNFRDAFKKKI